MGTSRHSRLYLRSSNKGSFRDSRPWHEVENAQALVASAKNKGDQKGPPPRRWPCDPRISGKLRARLPESSLLSRSG